MRQSVLNSINQQDISHPKDKHIRYKLILNNFSRKITCSSLDPFNACPVESNIVSFCPEPSGA
jgi:hypothetical protein